MRNREERIRKVTRISTIIIGVIISVYGYVMYFIDLINNFWLRLGIVTAFIISTFLVAFFVREKIFNKILKVFWISDSKDKKLLGQWHIYIFLYPSKEPHIRRICEITR